jgi:hypothetical protein
MTKREVIAQVAHRHPQHSPQEIAAAVNAVFATLTQALASGQRIELRDFGSFGLKPAPGPPWPQSQDRSSRRRAGQDRALFPGGEGAAPAGGAAGRTAARGQRGSSAP